MFKSSVLNQFNQAEEEHKSLVSLCESGGGPKGIKRHVETNKKILARDRLKMLLDEDSDFFEISATAGMGLEYGDVPCAGTVVGIGKVNDVSCHESLKLPMMSFVKAGSTASVSSSCSDPSHVFRAIPR